MWRIEIWNDNILVLDNLIYKCYKYCNLNMVMVEVMIEFFFKNVFLYVSFLLLL